MLSFALKRFPHWTTTKHSGKKYITNRNLNLKPEPVIPKYHDNIIFKNYTGNEILKSFNHVSELRPSEIASALIELNFRHGAPENYNWNENEKIQKVVEFTKPRITQYKSRVLTSLALGFDRLNIKDDELWRRLSQSILKYGTRIEAKGLAYSWNTFIGKGCKNFYETSLKYLPNHFDELNGRELLFVVRGIVSEGLEVEDLFERILNKFILLKKKEMTPEQLSEMISLLENRTDVKKEVLDQLQEAYNYKLRRKQIRLGLVPEQDDDKQEENGDETKDGDKQEENGDETKDGQEKSVEA